MALSASPPVSAELSTSLDVFDVELVVCSSPVAWVEESESIDVVTPVSVPAVSFEVSVSPGNGVFGEKQPMARRTSASGATPRTGVILSDSTPLSEASVALLGP